MKNFIKKYSIFIIFILILAFVYIICGKITNVLATIDDDDKVYSTIWNPRDWDHYLSASATDVLALSMCDWGIDYNALWTRFNNLGNGACFRHPKGSPVTYGAEITTEINAVYTFTNDSCGNLIVKSYTDSKTSGSTSYVAGNSNLGLFVSQLEVNNNVYGVYTYLQQAISNGDLIRYLDYSNGTVGDVTNSSKYSQDHVQSDNYSAYKRISHTDPASSPEETKEITYNDKSYTVIGPFKMKYGYTSNYAGIKSIKVGSTVVWNSSTNYAYYLTSSTDTTPESITRTKLPSDGTSFYLAILTEKLPDDGTYTIRITQEDFEYYKARLIVTGSSGNSSYNQALGGYAHLTSSDGGITTISGKYIEWSVTANRGKTLKLIKYDINGSTSPGSVSNPYTTTSSAANGFSSRLYGAGFIIYAKDTADGSGWLSGTASGDKTLQANINNASKYTITSYSGLEIKKLKPGTYYIYEVTAPTAFISSTGTTTATSYYPLYVQDRYMVCSVDDHYKDLRSEGSITNTKYTKWAYMGYVELTSSGSSINSNIYERQIISATTSNSTTTVRLGNYRTATLKIEKKDDSGNDLSGAKFVIYFKGMQLDGTASHISGWMYGSASTSKTYVTANSTLSNVTQYSKGTISYLAYGTYYIYEVTAPSGCDLRNQDNYMATGNCTTAENALNNAGIEYSYCGSISIDNTDVKKKKTTSNPTPTVTTKTLTNSKSGQLTIEKKDANTSAYLRGAQFIIYCDVSTPTDKIGDGWLNGNATDIKSYGDYSSKKVYTVTSTTGKLKLTNLLYGTYYIYEVKAPTAKIDGTTADYDLRNQDNYMATGNCTRAESDLDQYGQEYVYCGSVRITKDDKVQVKTVTNYKSGELTIEKQDADTSTYLKGAQFIIYCKTTSSKVDDGWLSGSKASKKTYVEYSSRTTYTVLSTTGKLELTKLIYGTYYIYEVKAPTAAIDGTTADYDLSYQDNYMATGNCTQAENDLSNDGKEYVYCGSVTINKTYKVRTKTVGNYKSGELIIEKQDADTGEALTGAQFIIYCDTSSSKVGDGWLKGSATKAKTYVGYSSKTTYKVTGSDGILDITKLIYGTYYIYEIKAPTGYFLKYQEGYMETGNCTQAENDLSNDGIEYVYCDSVTITKTDKIATLPVENEYFANVTIIKKDSSSGKKIEGMGFKIYNNTNGKWLCWNDNGEATGTDRHYTDEEVGQTDNEDNASIFYTNSSGQIVITHIDVGAEQSINERSFTVYEVDSENLYYKTDTSITQETTVTTKSKALFTFTLENTKAYSLNLRKYDWQKGTSVSITAYVYIQYFCPEDETDSVGANYDGYWLTQSGTYKSTRSKIAVSSDEYTVISDILRGTYVVYECQTPTGYDRTQQYGYNSSTGYVECGEIVVGDGYGGVAPKYNYESDTDSNSLISTVVSNGYKSPSMLIFNRKFVRSLTGIVWIDNKDGKADENDSLYYSASNDSLLSGIKVTLYKINSSGESEAIATTKTNSSGRYTFKRELDSDPEYNIYREVLYWDLTDYYVSFEYDNETYICVDPFATGSNSNYDYDDINSKAQEYSMEQAELEDANLLATGGSSNPGYAITTIDATNLTDTGCLANYYNEKNYTIENINLGLWVKENPTYSITETLAYAYVTINGFTYIYYYDEPTDTYTYENYDNLPDVMKQVNSKDYVAADHVDKVSVYESDIASTYPTDTTSTAESNLKVYLVYSIYVYNSETLTADDVYNEQNLYLTSLTDKYDKSRLELSDDNTDNSQYTGSSQFNMWTDTSLGVASYSLFSGNSANSNSVYRNGIDPGETIKTYIQFKVTDSALKLLINNSETIYQLNENKATTAYASGFHEYLRTDNVWREDLSYTEYASNTNKYPRRNAKNQNITYATSNDNGDTYFIHKSRVKDVESPAHYVAIQTGGIDSPLVRTISGVVYEDVAEESTYTYNNTTYTTYVGNGKIDSTETNRAEGVKVELLKASTVSNLSGLQVAYLYAGTAIAKAETKTNEKGEYSFEGVIPGYYYIRFTYGDGTQEIVDTSGNRVDYLTSTDYKSTILDSSSSLKDAMESSWPDYNDITDSEHKEIEDKLVKLHEKGESTNAQKLLEWYKYLDTTSYNTATDDLNMRDKYNNYVYTEKGIYADNTYTTLIVEYKYDDDGNLIQMVDTTTGNTIATYDEDGNVTYSYNANNSYPFNIQAYTPETAISIENTIDNYTSKDTHEEIYDDFDFGVVKQPETGTEITKTIDDISIIVQTGSTLVSSLESKYVSVLDSMQQYIGVELNEETLYGSDVEVTYKVEVENTSQVDYIESENSDDYGTYYKYGTITSSTTAKTITVNEVIDDIDEKYETSNLDGATVTQTWTKSDSSTIVLDDSVTITKLDTSTDSTLGENTTTTTTSVTFTGWNEISTGESVSITYTVDSLLNASEDTLYTNPARVTSLSLNQLTTLTSSYEWGERSWTEVSVYPSTGGDMRNVLIIAGTIILIVGACGIILIRKKVL